MNQSRADDSGEERDGAVSCASCGAQADAALARLSWSSGVERGRRVWTCEDCLRRHARSIEAKLDSEWW